MGGSGVYLELPLKHYANNKGGRLGTLVFHMPEEINWRRSLPFEMTGDANPISNLSHDGCIIGDDILCFDDFYE